MPCAMCARAGISSPRQSKVWPRAPVGQQEETGVLQALGAVSGERFQGLDDARMQRPPALL
jgi:hypothetical protein